MDEFRWRKSSYSGDKTGDCVEVGFADDPDAPVGVRDSKDPQGGMFTVSQEGWAGLIHAVRSGQV